MFIHVFMQYCLSYKYIIQVYKHATLFSTVHRDNTSYTSQDSRSFETLFESFIHTEQILKMNSDLYNTHLFAMPRVLGTVIHIGLKNNVLVL